MCESLQVFLHSNYHKGLFLPKECCKHPHMDDIHRLDEEVEMALFGNKRYNSHAGDIKEDQGRNLLGKNLVCILS